MISLFRYSPFTVTVLLVELVSEEAEIHFGVISHATWLTYGLYSVNESDLLSSHQFAC